MRKKILIVEDNQELVKVMQIGLNNPYDTIPAMTGEQAVDMAVTQLPDLILMDIIMPEMNGLEAASLIRENPKTRSIPILAVTALNSHKDKEKCLKSGCDDYIAKPFTFEQLRSRIEKLLNQDSC